MRGLGSEIIAGPAGVALAAQPSAEGVLIGRSLALLATIALLGFGAYLGYYDGEYARLSQALDADLGTYRRLHWEPPVLRGTPGEGNAADEIYAALAGFPELPGATREALAARVYYGRPLDPEEGLLVRKHAAVLDALRAATRHTSSRTELVPERGELMRVPPYPRVVDAALLLLGQASDGAPDECLRAAADVIRMGQDLVPGAPLEAASISMRLTSLAAPVLARCALKADPVSTRKAAHELLVLATHPPPTGSCIELTDLVTASKLRQRAGLSNKGSVQLVFEAIKDRPMLLKTWEMYYTDPTRFRKITPEDYPDAIDDWKRDQDARTQTSLPYVAQDAAGVIDFLYDDMRGQALLRGLAIGIGTLAERSLRGRLPSEPIGLNDTKLRDPFRGKPLNYRFSEDGSELVLWSVGEDLRDGRGTDEWGPTAPLDVTVRIPLR